MQALRQVFGADESHFETFDIAGAADVVDQIVVRLVMPRLGQMRAIMEEYR